MSDLKKLLDGLRITVKSKDEVEITGKVYSRTQVEKAVALFRNLELPVEALGWGRVLTIMDEFEEPKPAPTWEPGMVVEINGSHGIIEGLRHVPAQRKPFTGSHWERLSEASVDSWMWILAACICDLHDELRRLKEK